MARKALAMSRKRRIQEWETAVKVTGDQGHGRVGMCLPPTGEPKDTGTPSTVLGKLSPNFPAATRAVWQIKPGLGAALIYPRRFQNVSGIGIPGGKHGQGHQ